MTTVLEARKLFKLSRQHHELQHSATDPLLLYTETRSGGANGPSLQHEWLEQETAVLSLLP